jgi:hypothetical protein
MTVRTEREQKVERQQKESGKKGGQKLEGLYVGEGFVLSTFSILILGVHLLDFGTPPLGITGSGRPSNPEGTMHKTFSMDDALVAVGSLKPLRRRYTKDPCSVHFCVLSYLPPHM